MILFFRMANSQLPKHGFLHKVFRQIGAVVQLDAGKTQEQLAGFGKLGVSQFGEGHNVLLSNE